MRVTGAERLRLRIGQRHYGDLGTMEAQEDHVASGRSTYGASKLAGEALISPYCFMFGMRPVRSGLPMWWGHAKHTSWFDLSPAGGRSNPIAILRGRRASLTFMWKMFVCAVMTATNVRPNRFGLTTSQQADYITVERNRLLSHDAAGIDPAA